MSQEPGLQCPTIAAITWAGWLGGQGNDGTDLEPIATMTLMATVAYETTVLQVCVGFPCTTCKGSVFSRGG